MCGFIIEGQRSERLGHISEDGSFFFRFGWDRVGVHWREGEEGGREGGREGERDERREKGKEGRREAGREGWREWESEAEKKITNREETEVQKLHRQSNHSKVLTLAHRQTDLDTVECTW